MVALVQRLERLAVAEEVMGSNPIGHPNTQIRLFIEAIFVFLAALHPARFFAKLG